MRLGIGLIDVLGYFEKVQCTPVEALLLLLELSMDDDCKRHLQICLLPAPYYFQAGRIRAIWSTRLLSKDIGDVLLILALPSLGRCGAGAAIASSTFLLLR